MALNRINSIKESLLLNLTDNELFRIYSQYTPEAQQEALLNCIDKKIISLGAVQKNQENSHFFSEEDEKRIREENINYIDKYEKAEQTQVEKDIIDRGFITSYVINGSEFTKENSTFDDRLQKLFHILPKDSNTPYQGRLINPGEENQKQAKLFPDQDPSFEKKLLYLTWPLCQTNMPDTLSKLNSLVMDKEPKDHEWLWGTSTQSMDLNDIHDTFTFTNFKDNQISVKKTTEFYLCSADLGISSPDKLLTCIVDIEYVVDLNSKKPTYTDLNIRIKDLKLNDKKLNVLNEDEQKEVNDIQSLLTPYSESYKEELEEEKLEKLEKLKEVKRFVQTRYTDEANKSKDLESWKKLVLWILKPLSLLGINILKDWEKTCKNNQKETLNAITERIHNSRPSNTKGNLTSQRRS